MRACVFFSLVLLLASVRVTGQDYPGSSGSESIIVRSWHFTTLNEAPMSASGDALDVASAAPPALNMGIGFGQPFLIAPSANTTLVGEHGIYGAGALTSDIHRGVVESFTADDPDGFVVTETAGDGSAAVTEENTHVAQGGASVLFTLTGTTSHAEITSVCMNIDETKDYFLQLWAKKLTGTVDVEVTVTSWSDAGCSADEVLELTIDKGDIAATWAEIGPTLSEGAIAIADWAGTAAYATIEIKASDGAAGSFVVDAIQFNKDRIVPTSAFCGDDSDASVACNLIDMTTTPPTHMVGTWEFEATIRSSIDGAVVSTKTIMFAPATAGNNNKIFFFLSGDVLFCDVYDSAGNQKRSTVAAAYNADTDYTVKMSKDALTGTVQCCFDGTCDAAPATGAFTDGIGSEIVFGSTGFTGGEVWIQDPVIRRRLTP